MSAHSGEPQTQPVSIIVRLHPCCKQHIDIYDKKEMKLVVPNDADTLKRMQEKYKNAPQPKTTEKPEHKAVCPITEKEWKGASPRQCLLQQMAPRDTQKLCESILDKIKSSFDSIRTVSNVATLDRSQLYSALAEAYGDFRDIAVQYAMANMFERGVIRRQRTQKNDPKEKGLAGGEKIVCIDCVRFKNPERGTADLYPQAYKALKTCKHELTGTDAFIEALLRTRDDIGCTPIPAPCIVIDYLGYRLIASLNLSLGDCVVGKDGGNREAKLQNDHFYVKTMNTVLEDCGLAPHKLKEHSDLLACALPFDAEVRRSGRPGDQSTVFLVDLARLIPPRGWNSPDDPQQPKDEEIPHIPDGSYVTPNVTDNGQSPLGTKEQFSLNPVSPQPVTEHRVPMTRPMETTPATTWMGHYDSWDHPQPVFLQFQDSGSSDSFGTPPTILPMPQSQQAPVTQKKRGDFPYLYCHFRKEFVRKYANEEEPLSSDALNISSMTKDDIVLTVAWIYYLKNIPKQVADYLLSIEDHVEVFSDDLVRIVHYYGLNLCHLGYVYHLLKPESRWRRRILVEVAARSFRRVVHKILRRYVKKGDVHMSEVKKRIAASFNYVLGKNEGTEEKKMWGLMNTWKDECFPSFSVDAERWRDEFFPELELTEVTLKRADIIINADAKKDVMLGNFLWVSSELLGVRWEPALWNAIQYPSYFDTHDEPFDAPLLRAVHPRVMEMNIAHHSLGVAQMSSDSGDETKTGLKAAVRSLKQALDRQPTNEHTLDRLARVYQGLASMKGQSEQLRDEYLLKAKYLLEMAKNVPRPHADSLFAWALHCLTSPEAGDANREAQLEEAANTFELAKISDPIHRHAGMMRADVEYLGLGADPKTVVKCVEHQEGQEEGCNLLHHRFVYQCLANQWDAAAETAGMLRKRLKTPLRGNDVEIDKNLTEFEKAIGVFSSSTAH